MTQTYPVQPLLWPCAGICTETGLYYHKDQLFSVQDIPTGGITLETGEIADFTSWFNAFPMAKWRKYTFVEEIGLRLRGNGEILLRILIWDYSNGNAVAHTVLEKNYNLSVDDVEIILPHMDGILCGFCIQAREDLVHITGGEWFVNKSSFEPVPVGLALNICTRKREKFVKRNLQILADAVLDNPKSQLHGFLRVYITDNAQTLTKVEVDFENVVLNGQNGFGSAGGFARGQLAILKDAEQYGLTHLIYMDDDILFDPSVVERTWWFLRFMQPKWHDYVVGGALLNLHNPAIQHESGAMWQAGRIASVKHALDLRDIRCVLLNEIEEKVEYQGWWYSCVPLSAGLPLPLYFHRDDVEHGLRQPGFIYLNGIGVWHDEFDHKYSAAMEYYDFRNMLIVNSVRCLQYGVKQAKKDLTKLVINRLLCYRYREAELVLQAVDDFCRGMDYVLSLDSAAHDDTLIQQGYKTQPLGELPVELDMAEYNQSQVLPPRQRFRIIKMVAALLHSKTEYVFVPMYRPLRIACAKGRKVLNIDLYNERFFVTEKNIQQIISWAFALKKRQAALGRYYRAVSEQWRQNADKLTTVDFWSNHLGLHSLGG